MTKAWVENTARGSYRDESWESGRPLLERGDYVTFDPFREQQNMWPVYCTFIQYHGDELKLAEIRVPKCGEDSKFQWFTLRPGNYIVHEQYLTPK